MIRDHQPPPVPPRRASTHWQNIPIEFVCQPIRWLAHCISNHATHGGVCPVAMETVSVYKCGIKKKKNDRERHIDSQKNKQYGSRHFCMFGVNFRLCDTHLSGEIFSIGDFHEL